VISAYHAKYYAHELTRRHAADGVDRLSQSLFDASVDLNPHQIEAALFALRNPLQEGVLLADEVGLGKTIEAALVVCQYWAERRRRLLVICPASLRKQWAQELQDKFAVPTTVVDAVSLRKQSAGDILATLQRQVGKAVVIMSYQFAAKLEAELRAVHWDVVVIDEAHKMRNAHRPSNRIGQALKRALQGRKKLLLTATPQQLGAAMRTDAMLFDNRLATNWVAWSKDGDRGQQLWAGRDPPEGALISYHSRHRHRRRRPSRLPIRAAQWCADSRDCRMTLA
jgi:SNF2 family DNA or RNA helicase